MTKNRIAGTTSVWLLGAVLAVACGSGQPEAKSPGPARTFVYSPGEGIVFQHEMNIIKKMLEHQEINLVNNLNMILMNIGVQCMFYKHNIHYK